MTIEKVLHQPDTPETAAACARWAKHFSLGPQETRWTKVPLQVGDLAPSVPLVNARTKSTEEISDYWSRKPALLLFWRHFGCGCGRERSTKLIEEMNLYRPLGVNVVIIGQGEPERANVYLQANKIPDDVSVLLDATESAYRAYGILDCGPLEVLFDAPDEYLRREAAAAENIIRVRQDAGMPLVDNPWLLPAEFVISTKGEVVYAYRYQFCENWIDPRVHVGAIRIANGELPRW